MCAAMCEDLALCGASALKDEGMVAGLRQRIEASAFALVKTLEFELELPTEDADAGLEAATMRLELFESVNVPGRFRARLSQLEFFRIKPTFPQTGGEPSSFGADERIWKEFAAVPPSLSAPREFDSAEEALEFVLETVTAWARNQLGLR
ncbi:MAG: hypothetical protein K0R38_591 [Polyangiaceae bacterium]|jgi:hypothetical protein|nr:hypothetical protein [Polyangiaceae bacterium]